LLHRRDELHGPGGDLGVERSQARSLPVREAEKGEGRAVKQVVLQHNPSTSAKSHKAINRTHALGLG